MQRQMLKSKIHRATVTDRDPDYVGSLTLDPELMQSADLIANEQLHVWDIDNGARFVTYAIEGEPGSGAVRVNGAAARLVSQGDKLIVASFGAYDERELERIRSGGRACRRPQRDHRGRLPPRGPAALAAGLQGRGVMNAQPNVPAGRSPVTVPRLAEMKHKGEPIVMVTAYDFPSAQVAEEAGVDIALVGDTAAMVVLGYDATTPVGMDEMVTMAAAVRRGLRTPLLIGDLTLRSSHTHEVSAGSERTMAAVRGQAAGAPRRPLALGGAVRCYSESVPPLMRSAWPSA